MDDSRGILIIIKQFVSQFYYFVSIVNVRDSVAHIRTKKNHYDQRNFHG
jgi:hypothetical protein